MKTGKHTIKLSSRFDWLKQWIAEYEEQGFSQLVINIEIDGNEVTRYDIEPGK